MRISGIEIDNKEFCTDSQRNIFLLPVQILESKLLPWEVEDKARIPSDDFRAHGSFASGLEEEKYEHETVFLFNCKGLYEMPCREAAEHILAVQDRKNLLNYVYHRRWADVKPEEAGLISVFLYDLIKAKKENKEGDVSGYAMPVDAVHGSDWLRDGGKEKRISSSDRTQEIAQSLKEQRELSGKIGKPLDTIIQDKSTISQEALHLKDEKDDSQFFNNFKSNLSELHEYAISGQSDEPNSMLASQIYRPDSDKKGKLLDAAMELVGDAITIGTYTAAGTITGALVGFTGGAAVGEGGGAAPAGGAIVGAVVGCMTGVKEAAEHDAVSGDQKLTPLDKKYR